MVLIYTSEEELKEQIEEGNPEICDLMVKAIEKGISKNYKKVKVFTFKLIHNPQIKFAFYLTQDQWELALEGIEIAYSQVQQYEKCRKVKTMREGLKLKSKKLDMTR